MLPHNEAESVATTRGSVSTLVAGANRREKHGESQSGTALFSTPHCQAFAA